MEDISPSEIIDQDAFEPVDESQMNDEEIIAKCLPREISRATEVSTRTLSNKNMPSAAEVVTIGGPRRQRGKESLWGL